MDYGFILMTIIFILSISIFVFTQIVLSWQRWRDQQVINAEARKRMEVLMVTRENNSLQIKHIESEMVEIKLILGDLRRGLKRTNERIDADK